MIRKAEAADRSLLRPLFSEFYATDAVLHGIPSHYHDAALDELFSPGSLQIAYLLGTDRETAGYALISKKYSHEAGGMEWWLEELYLRPQFQGQGLGSAFFSFLLAEAKRENVRRLRLEVEPENTRAAALYARFGFQPLGYGQMAWTEENP